MTKQEQQRKKFLYDHTGVFAVKHNNATYFYRKDAQSNIVALLDNTGAIVVEYKYDAWGKCVIDASTTNTIASTISICGLGMDSNGHTRNRSMVNLQSMQRAQEKQM